MLYWLALLDSYPVGMLLSQHICCCISIVIWNSVICCCGMLLQVWKMVSVFHKSNDFLRSPTSTKFGPSFSHALGCPSHSSENPTIACSIKTGRFDTILGQSQNIVVSYRQRISPIRWVKIVNIPTYSSYIQVGEYPIRSFGWPKIYIPSETTKQVSG